MQLIAILFKYNNVKGIIIRTKLTLAVIIEYNNMEDRKIYT